MKVVFCVAMTSEPVWKLGKEDFINGALARSLGLARQHGLSPRGHAAVMAGIWLIWVK